jgi:putative FmdB family regulatory protein
MPLYDYKCNNHGVFAELNTIANAEKPVKCPQCGALCARVLTLSPQIINMLKEKKQAMERNEKARHEPLISTLDRRQNDKQHASDCGCSGGSVKNSKMFYTAAGNKMFPSMRPWMISH